MPHYGKIQTNHSLKYGRKLSIKFPKNGLNQALRVQIYYFLGLIWPLRGLT